MALNYEVRCSMMQDFVKSTLSKEADTKSLKLVNDAEENGYLLLNSTPEVNRFLSSSRSRFDEVPVSPYLSPLCVDLPLPNSQSYL